MTGPSHYRAAENLMAKAGMPGHEDPQEPDRLLAAAQVHATLALAAATALGLGRADDHGMLPEDANAWQDTAGFPLRSGGAE